MIPKIIHYCWFGRNPLPPLAQECIASWKKFFPDYEIKEWNEDNFDVNSISYTAEAYSKKKYAFVSDYARFVILHEYGGVYFDTDVEVIRPMDDILSKGSFMGFEENPTKFVTGQVAPGLGLACEKGDKLLKELIEIYKTLSFLDENGNLNQKTICQITTELLVNHGMTRSLNLQEIDGYTIYPSDFFAPIHFVTKKLHITNNTRTIHRYMASWVDQKNKTLSDYLRHYLPEFILILINRIKRRNEWI